MGTLLNPTKTENQKVENPIESYYSWSAENGTLIKNKEEVNFPFSFVVLETANKVAQCDPGASDEDQIFSQLFENTKDPVLFFSKMTGKYKSNFEGSYSDQKTKDFCAVHSLAFTQILFIAVPSGEGFELGQISFNGKSMSAFFDFTKNLKEKGTDLAQSPGLTITGFEEALTSRKKKTNIPVFKSAKISAQSIEKILSICDPLREYLDEVIPARQKAEKEEDLPAGFESEGTDVEQVTI